MTPLRNRTVAVVGFGNQGHAHALNLRDSGIRVVVGARRDSAGARRAIEHGFEPLDIAAAVSRADLVILALPDEVQAEVYQQHVAPKIKAGATLGFLHGFAIRYEFIRPRNDVGVILVAPKGPGKLLRESFTRGFGIPCLMAIHQDSPVHDSEAIALAWTNGIGCARAGIICTTFAAEAETDLFGEQAVLCGGLNELIVAGFETLVDAGYPAELAYLECCHEVKQIADLIYERGLAGMRQAISNTAEFGAYRAGPFLIDDSVRARMRQLLEKIRDGTFAHLLREDHERGFGWFHQQRLFAENHPIQSAGSTIRSLMPWLSEPDAASKDLE